MQIRLAVLTDCAVVRAALETLVAGPDLELVGFAASAEELLELVHRKHPDVVVVCTVEDTAGVCRSIARHRIEPPLLIISPRLDEESVRAAIEARTRGFLYKDWEVDQLKGVVQRLAAGESVLDSRVTGRVISWAAQRPEAAKANGLSDREIDVLRQVAQGEPNKRIARRLGITENTVKTYLRRAFRKLGCDTRSSAAAAVARMGLI